jgi:valyl-tRNA synthetase
MNSFPKIYKHKNIKKPLKPNHDYKNIYSSLLPGDQKMHPGCMFSVFMQDLFLEINNLIWNNYDLNLWFGLSSKFYSKLNNKDLVLRNLQTEVTKKIKQNNKFFEKNWIYKEIKQNNSVYWEEFNIYIRKVFVDLYQNNKIFFQKEVVYRSKEFQTNLFKNNISIQQKDVYEYNLKYFIESKWVTINIPTTKIETIFADVAVAVNPQDKRYKKLIWQNVIIPIINKSIPIIWDDSVDSFIWSWVVRVTPWHDQYWLEMAQKHWLQTDVYAIDTDWNFTENVWDFSNKPLSEFLQNVIKYIDDIWNLESKTKTKQELYFDLRSGEKLDEISLNQWNINYSYSLDYLLQEFNTDKINVYPIDYKNFILQNLETKQSINISSKSKKWLLIPILRSNWWENFAINDDILLSKYKEFKSKKNLTLTLIVSNLILDNQLQNSFYIEDLIDILFLCDLSWNKTKIEKYIEIYENQKITDYKKWLKDIKKLIWKIEKDKEKIKLISELLENSFAIKSDWEKFFLDLKSIFNKEWDPSFQKEDWFNKSFIDSVWFLYQNELSYSNSSYENIKNLAWLFLSSFDDKDFAINTILLILEYSKKIIFSDLFFHNNLVDLKSNKITNYNSKFLTKDLTECIDFYGTDITRLLLLLWDKEDKNTIFNTYKAQEWNSVLNKIWNANRYVYSKYLKSNRTIKIKDLLKNIETDISDYDSWILHGVKSIVDDFQYQIVENKTIDLWNKIFHFVTNTLCDKYLESTKIYETENTHKVVIFCFSIILKLLKPYIPCFVWEVESYFNVDRSGYNPIDFKEFELKEKNYKINIIMDIVDKLNWIKTKLWSRKHESIDVFVQANPEFISFLSENDVFFRSLVNIQDIDYIRLHEDLPIWYEVDNVININIWAKKVLEQKEVNKNVLQEMEKDLKEKLEHIQHLKSLIASVMNSAPPELIMQKRKYIEKLQNEIEELEFNINKLKIK